MFRCFLLPFLFLLAYTYVPIVHSALLCTDILRFSLVNDDRRRNKRAEIIVEKKTFQGTGKEVLPANLSFFPADFSK